MYKVSNNPLIAVLFWSIFLPGVAMANKPTMTDSSEYIVAAYVWPSCHDEVRSRDKLWGEGIGEWEIIKKGKPLFDGHFQPRVPLWGYRFDDDPAAWEQKIEAAVDHKVNTFIFDWYWYDGGPFLEEALNSGFLKARNMEKVNFYIMWANHDVPGNMWNHHRYSSDSLLWKSYTDWDNFETIVNRVIKQYFSQPNYLKIDGCPVFSIYDIEELVKNFGGIEHTKEAVRFFRNTVKRAGFPGLHLQAVGRGGRDHQPYLITDGEDSHRINEIVSEIGFNSITMYNWDRPGLTDDYLVYGEGALKLRDKWDEVLDVPFFPCISVGWDNSPRYPNQPLSSIVRKNNTPDSFGAYLQKNKEFVDKHPDRPKLIVINAWNEWVEGSYLEPDMRWGYRYLEEVKRIISGASDKYARPIFKKN